MTETDFEAYVENLYKYVPADATSSDRYMLEHNLITLPDEKLMIFAGALEIEHPKSMDAILAIVPRLNNYRMYGDVTSPDGLGRRLAADGTITIPKEALPYVDYSRVAAEYESKYKGAYTEDGYVYKTGDGEPEPRKYFVRIDLSSARLDQYGARYPLYLPASDCDFDDAMNVMGVDSLEECVLRDIEVSVESLPKDILPDHDESHSEIELYNELVKSLFELHKTYLHVPLFMAAVEIEQPDNVKGLLDIADNLRRYELIPDEYQGAEGYGEYLLYHSDQYNHRGNEKFEAFKDDVRDYIDFAAFGTDWMREHGVRLTDHGLLRRLDRPFPAEETQSPGMSMNQ